jgi:hypothetical protein
MWNQVTCNPAYEDFLKAKEAKRFHKSLNEIRPLVDSSRPKQVKHLKKRSKKNQIIDFRQKDIDHSNKVLMEKMINIEKRLKSIGSKHSKRSLNKESRCRFNFQVNQENMKLLERLQSAQPAICLKRWEIDERHWMSLRDNIRKVPRRNSRPNSSRDAKSFELIEKILKRRNTRPTTALSCDFGN